MISLAYPWFLVLALLPLLLLARKPRSEPAEAPVIPVGHWLSDMPGVSTTGQHLARWRRVVLTIAWLCLVLALARPQHVGEE
ncbi:MAG: BatA domain-containing protein, partial [Marinobacter sp.]